MDNKLIQLNKEVAMTSLEVIEMINNFRKEEGNTTKKEHRDFMKSIRKEIETLEKAGIANGGNFSLVSYIDAKGEERPCFEMNKTGIMQMLNKESALVRYKTQQYIEALEDKISNTENTKEALLLQLFSADPLTVANAHKKLVELETKPLIEKIEEDKPLVEFSNSIARSSDSIDIGTFAKLIKDENINMGRNKLFKWLRDNGYLMKDNKPYQRYIDNKYFEIVEYVCATPYGDKNVITTLITGIGQIKITEKLRKVCN